MFNKIVIVGRLGNAPTTKNTKTGTSMCSFTVAVNSGWGDSKTTDWYSVSVFGKQAEFCSTYLSKGSLVCVSGSIRLQEYMSKDGSKKTSINLTADSVNSIGGKQEASYANEQQTPNDSPKDGYADFDESIADVPF